MEAEVEVEVEEVVVWWMCVVLQDRALAMMLFKQSIKREVEHVLGKAGMTVAAVSGILVGWSRWSCMTQRLAAMVRLPSKT